MVYTHVKAKMQVYRYKFLFSPKIRYLRVISSHFNKKLRK